MSCISLFSYFYDFVLVQLGDLAEQGAKSHWFIETTGKILSILFRSLIDPVFMLYFFLFGDGDTRRLGKAGG